MGGSFRLAQPPVIRGGWPRPQLSIHSGSSGRTPFAYAIGRGPRGYGLRSRRPRSQSDGCPGYGGCRSGPGSSCRRRPKRTADPTLRTSSESTHRMEFGLRFRPAGLRQRRAELKHRRLRCEGRRFNAADGRRAVVDQGSALGGPNRHGRLVAASTPKVHRGGSPPRLARPSAGAPPCRDRKPAPGIR